MIKPEPILLQFDAFLLRPWQKEDVSSIVRYANNRNIWRNLRDAFPHPYTEADGERFIAMTMAPDFKNLFWAIVVENEACGGIGIHPFDDVYCHTAEVGYWLGEPFWGHGIASQALKAVTEYAFTHLDLMRIQAGIFEWNPASARVLEKAGYELEGRKRLHVTKDGRIMDEIMYVRLKETD